MKRIAIIGAGIAGATLSRKLLDHGFSVEVFEKSRGTGGRLSSARLGELTADLGATTIESSSQDFESFLSGLQSQGMVERWSARHGQFDHLDTSSAQYWLGKGRNSAMTRGLLNGVALKTQTRVGVVWSDNQGVLIRDEHGELLDYYDAVAVAAPAPQAVPLLESVPRFAHRAQSVTTSANWVVLLELPHLPSKLVNVDVVEGHHQSIERITIESNKPGRSGTLIKLEMRESWSASRLDDNREALLKEIIDLFSVWCGESVKPLNSRLHRWLFNRSTQTAEGDTLLWDSSLNIGACGDWVSQPGIEGAWRSASVLADEMIDSLK